MTRKLWCILACAFGVISCNQPFAPDAPGNSRLVMYSILNVEQGTQYVRLQSTSPADPGAPLREATVRMKFTGGVVQFRDTVIERTLASGSTELLDVYVANNVAVKKNQNYVLEASTPSGLSAQATTTALALPDLYVKDPGGLGKGGNGPITLGASFGSVTGAWEMHFTIEFYALINGGWELRREEVPLRQYYSNAGTLVKVYSRLSPVPGWVSPDVPLVVEFDTLLYQQTRSKIALEYTAAPVVFMYAVFSLTQVDNVLYSYYYIANGTEDRTSIRLDTPEFTNILGGVGVFGCCARVYERFTLRE
jgi:hypothetical protein